MYFKRKGWIIGAAILLSRFKLYLIFFVCRTHLYIYKHHRDNVSVPIEIDEKLMRVRLNLGEHIREHHLYDG